MDGIKIHRFRYGADEEETIAYSGQMQSAIRSLQGLIRFRKFLNRWHREAELLLTGQRPFDAVAGHWLIPTGVVLQTIVRTSDLPCLLSSHGTDLRIAGKFGALSRLYFDSLLHKLDSWTVVSSYLKQQASQIAPHLREKLAVVTMPHDTKIFYRDESIARDPNLIVSVARFTKQKRVGLLIDAFLALADRYPAARLELYGGGPLRTALETKIAATGLGNRMSLLDAVPQRTLHNVYNRAGIVVLNSFREGFGLALSEAMLCGAAVVGTRSGGIVDIIDNERTGLLAEEDNVDSLTAALDRLLGNDALRLRLGANGMAEAQSRFTAETSSAAYARLVRSAVDRHREMQKK